jgi:hypothetical protein
MLFFRPIRHHGYLYVAWINWELAVDPANGDVYVQFYDRRDDSANRTTRVTRARSTDHGKSFANFAWSDAPFAGDNMFLGPYSWLVARQGRVHGVWVEALPPDTTTTQRRACTVVKVGTADFNRPR